MTEPILSGRKLNKSYTNRIGREVSVVQPLQDVDFDLYPGEILGIVGESGCGKSTLLKVVCGIEKPDSGQVFHKGEDYTGSKPEKTGDFIQMVFQDAYGSFDPRMTMQKALREAPGFEEQEMLRVIREVGLPEHLLGRRPRGLSGGQCQRMSVARALLSNAEILLCDEITSALDVTTQAQVIRLIREIREKENVSIMFVSHDLALVSQISDRIIVMKDGVIVETGETASVIGSPAEEYTKQLLNSVMAV